MNSKENRFETCRPAIEVWTSFSEEIKGIKMSDNKEPAEAGRQYKAAYAMHYEKKDLHSAINLYKGIIISYPDTREAEYSKSQIQNIVKAVVPEQLLLNAFVDLTIVQLDRKKDNTAVQVQIKPKPETTADK